MLGTIIGLASGALGGIGAGSLMKKSSLGTMWNAVAGIAGGGIGATILNMVGLGGGAADGAMSTMGILSNVGGGLVGGGVVMTVIGMIKSAMGK